LTIEWFILIAISVISLGSILYIPSEKYRLALVSFLAFEATTWASINILVQTGAIAFPIRIFTRATQVGFLQNFMFYPVIFVWFMLLYPSNLHIIRKILHYLFFVSAVVWFIFFISIYTDLEHFTKGTKLTQLSRLYPSFLLQFGLCHLYVHWFFRKTKLGKGV
jgi:hypothetical protein